MRAAAPHAGHHARIDTADALHELAGILATGYLRLCAEAAQPRLTPPADAPPPPDRARRRAAR